jgi:hypothetical protein
MRPEPNFRFALGLCVLATLLVLAGGLWVHWPWLRAEHSRLPPTLAVGIWAADGAALFGLAWFTIRYAVLGRTRPADQKRGARARLLLAAGLIWSHGIDLTSALLTASGESAGWARAAVADGQIVGGRPSVNGEKAYLLCRFQTPDGGWHEGWVHVHLAGQVPAVRGAVERGQFPVAVQVRYDPAWPPRCWLDGFNNQEENRLQWMSLSFLLFQTLAIPVAVAAGEWRTATGLVPVYQVFPLAASLVPFTLAALVKGLMGEY